MTYDKSYHHREEIEYNRSEWCTGRVLAFKPTGRGFAPRQSLSFSHGDVGDAFQIINHISAVYLQPALCLFHTWT